MTKIHLIIGLPGSGKTHYANSVLGHLPLVDDPKDKTEWMLDADEFVVTDPNFCNHFILGQAEHAFQKHFLVCEIVKYYFENNPQACRANVKHRADGRNVEGTINRFAPIYNPPAGAMKIWTKN